MPGLFGVRRQEHLVLAPTREPRPVALVALDRSSIPRLAAVRGREERVVREVDARVVHAAARVLSQVGIAEARVFAGIGEKPGPQIVEALPVASVVVGAPQVHLVSVVGAEVERILEPWAVDVGCPLVRRVDERVMDVVGHYERLAAGEMGVHVLTRRKRERIGRRGARAGAEHDERAAHERPDACQ